MSSQPNLKPPKIAEKLLSYVLYDDIWKSMMGDLHEYYAAIREEEGKAKADAWYWRQVIRYAPSKVIHKLIWSVEMFLNYLKISFRNLFKHKSYSVINILGLAIGLASFTLIALFVQYELSYDTFHENSDDTYRVIRYSPGQDYLGSDWFALTPTAMAETLKDQIPEVEAAAYYSPSQTLLQAEGNSSIETGISVDGDFFDVFTYSWIYGTPSEAITDPASMVLTRSVAEQFFGDKNPVGEVITLKFSYRDDMVKTITGVIENPPEHSHLSFSYVLNHRSGLYYDYNYKEWANTNEHTFITLRDDANVEEVEAKIAESIAPFFGENEYYQANPDFIPSYYLQPIGDIHLKSAHINFNAGTTGSLRFITMFSVIGIIILLIASVNYMNLCTARSLTRSKEVGVRKTIGAFRSNLITQFISEAVAISLVSVILAFITIVLFLPHFGELVNRNLSSQIFASYNFWFLMISGSLVLGILSGSYPAFFLSSFNPINVLKGRVTSAGSGTFVRNALVTLQFSITSFLIIGTLVVSRQLNYIQTTDTGYNRDQIISITSDDPGFWEDFKTVSQELSRNSNILGVTSSRYSPSNISSRTTGVDWEGKPEDLEYVSFVQPANFNFTELLDIDIVAGSPFNEDTYIPERTQFILNTTALRNLGWTKEEAIGKSFSVWGMPGEIAGIMEDFNFMSLHREIDPLILALMPDFQQRLMHVKISGQNIPETIAFLEERMAHFSPGFPFNYTFLDSYYENLYRDEVRLGSMFNSAALLALFIACIGLFGLFTFVVEQRTKEIGVRKILGASALQIVALLNRDLLKIITLSFFISVPLGWYAAGWWLSDFAYKVDLGAGIFVISICVTIAIALLTVSFKSVKTALTNPVNSLRSE
ncbi:MAG: ABC transporter permease [Bacteroidota bacterium]